MRNPIVILILAAAQFVMVLDSSVMNVSISQIVADLDTTIQGVQLAITLYTLVMAAFMLVGAKLGDIWGRDRTFAIGLAVYGIGLAHDGAQPKLAGPAHRLVVRRGHRRGARDPGDRRPDRVELRGQGAGARLRDHRRGRGGGDRGRAADRRLGDDSTWTWRLVFAGRGRGRVSSCCSAGGCGRARVRHLPELDIVGAVLSASAPGAHRPGRAPEEHLGLGRAARRSPRSTARRSRRSASRRVVYMILGGLGLLWAFAEWEERRARQGKDAPARHRAARDRRRCAPACRASFIHQLVLLGTFFVLPVYFQIVLGLDAFQTGLRLVPMS